MAYTSQHSLSEENRKVSDKQIILLGILLALVIFLFINRDFIKTRIEKRFYIDDEIETEYVSVLGSHVVEQPFVAESSSIGSVGIRFNNEQKNTATGMILLELIDPDGNTVSSAKLSADYIRESENTKFLFGGDSEIMNGNRVVNIPGRGSKITRIYVDKGETYTFRIETVDVQSEGAFDIVTCTIPQENKSSVLEASVDGNKLSDACLFMYTKNDVYSMKTVGFMAVLILLCALFVLLPFERIDNAFSKAIKREQFKLSTWVNRLMFAATPMVAYFVVQKYVDYGLKSFLRHITADPAKAPLNLMIIGFVMWLFYTISNSTKISSVLTMLIFSAFGFIDYALILFRGTPLVYTDIGQLQTAMQVADSYEIILEKCILWAIIFTVVWCTAIMALPEHKGFSGKKRLISLAVLVAWGITFYYSIFVSSVIEDHYFKVSGFKPTTTYYKNGCVLSFVISYKNTVVKAPDGYDIEKIRKLAEKYPSDDAARDNEVSRKSPNVIVVMNESFSDMSALGEFETNVDYLNFYRNLKENTVKGWMYSSVFGGSTANSEFECLTGFSMRFLPFQSVAYRSIIKQETPSLTSYMKARGYGGNIAFHPGLENSYNRNVIYPLLGFDDHISVEDVPEAEKIRDFVSDDSDYEIIEGEFEKFRKSDNKSPFYLFNVTIQNHGGYTFSKGVVDDGLEILTQDCNYENASQFLNLMKISDRALEHLIEYFSKVEEPTVILLFGDHQPRIDDEFYAALRAQHEGISDIEWTELTRKVPFMIWTNYDSTEKDNVTLSANYLSAYLKETMGMPLTGFDKYLLELHKQLPVINSIGYIDSEGKVYDPDETSKFDKIISEYEQIQYNGLIDYKDRIDSFFALNQ